MKNTNKHEKNGHKGNEQNSKKKSPLMYNSSSNNKWKFKNDS
jgi:hypothetical protein